MAWEQVIFSICVGAFWAGLVLTIILLLMSFSSFSSHGGADTDTEVHSDMGHESDLGHHVDLDHDVSIDHDISLDHDLSLDHDVSLDHHVDFDHETDFHHDVHADHLDHSLDHDLDHDIHSDLDSDVHGSAEVSSDIESAEIHEGSADFGHHLEAHSGDDFISIENHTPLSLIVSIYLLWFGAFGVILYQLINSILWLGIVVIAPILFTKAMSGIWKKISKNSTYRVRTGKELLGRTAIVRIDVSSNGGMVSVRNEDNTQQIPVKSLHPLSWFYEGETVIICDFNHGIYLVDKNPKEVKFEST